MANKTTVTITMTETKTTTMPASSLSCNIGVLKTPTGLLKLFETIIGIICLGLILHLSTPAEALGDFSSLLIQLAVFVFLVTTFLLLVSYLVSHMAANVLEKTIFELLYHFFACIFYLTSVVFMYLFTGNVAGDNAAAHNAAANDTAADESSGDEFGTAVALSVLALLNAIFYGASTYFSYKACKSS